MKAGKHASQLSLAGAIVLLCGAMGAQNSYGASNALPYDTPTVVDGVESVCTGVGVSDEDKKRWDAYPVKVVLAGKGGQYLGGATVTVSKDGKMLVSVECEGPWTLFKLAPGRYDVSATIKGENRTGVVYSPQSGQGRVIIRFLNCGGPVGPEHVPASP